MEDARGAVRLGSLELESFFVGQLFRMSGRSYRRSYRACLSSLRRTRKLSRSLEHYSSLQGGGSLIMPPSIVCQSCLRAAGRAIVQASRRPLYTSSSLQARRLISSHQPTKGPTAISKRSIATQGYNTTIDSSRSPLSDYSAPDGQTDNSKVLLKRNNLFHSFSNSPSPEIRRRAAFIKQHAYCPHHSHNATRQARDPEDAEASKPSSGGVPPAHVRFECPDCGIPVACSEEHFADEYEAHIEICDTLRQINEDDHDLRSGRFFPEFELQGPQPEEFLVNMTNWDTLLYTREFNAINEDRSMRQVTRLLTYPITVGSVLHELSPYDIRSGGRLTVEGLKSMSGKNVLRNSRGTTV